MSHSAVAYISTAVAGLTPADLDHLLVDARTHNKMLGVTGVLLYDGHFFFQYFEGPSEGVATIYARINASRMHVELHELQSGPVSQLYFPQWYMGCSHTEGSVLQKLSHQQWKREAVNLPDDLEQAGNSPGLRELQAFWIRLQGAAG